MYPTFNVQRASVSGQAANLGGTNSAFHVPGASSGSNSPQGSQSDVGEPSPPFLANGIQHVNLFTTLQAAAAAQQQQQMPTAVGAALPLTLVTTTVGTSKTVGTVLPLISPPKQINLQLSPIDRPIKTSPVPGGSSTDGMSSGACSICSDRATGKHYGANSCDGCKGFFRRTIRKNQTYACRFSRTCVIDKDKRNTCRYCRFRKCLQAGMRREAVQNERDRISCKRVKSESPPDSASMMTTTSSSSSTGGSLASSKFSTADTISFLLHAESVTSQIRASVITSTAVGANNNPASQQQQPRQQQQQPAPLSPNQQPQQDLMQPRLASVNDLSEAIKQQLLLLVEWAKLLPPFYDLPLDDQVALLRAYAAQHLLLGVARRSLPYKDVLLLGNDACIPRSHSSEIHDVNHVVLRLLDELVDPMREIQCDDTEYACIKALLFFNPNAYGLTMKLKVKETRQHVLEALQTYTNQKPSLDDDVVRFGNLLLLLPPLQAMSQQFIEDLQLATLFGMAKFDKLLEELLLAAAEPLSAPFLVDGISAVANKMAGGLMGLVGGNGHASNDHHQPIAADNTNGMHFHERENAGVLNTTKQEEDPSSMIVDVVTCSSEPSPATTY